MDASVLISMMAMAVPTATTSPSLAKIFFKIPPCVAGTSVSTLSVATSNTDSSASMESPSFLSQVRMVPSMILSPILGMSISTLAMLIFVI